MTASPDPHVGLPGGEEIAQLISGAAFPSTNRTTARAILSLIRPAFEAKDAEIERLKKLPVIADYVEVQDARRAAEAKLAQAVEVGKSLAEKLTKAEADVAAAGGAKAVYFDGSLLICHPDMPPHIWDGKIMVKIEPTAIALAEGKEG